MGDSSKIEWTDATWNPIVGCSITSPGCTHCYAMRMAARLESMAGRPRWTRKNVGTGHYAGTTQPSKAGPVWTGKLALAPEHILTAPLRWKKPRRIFVNSMGDLFHEDCPDAWIDQVFAVMALAPQHIFQVLTKRAERMRAYFDDAEHRAMAIGAALGDMLDGDWIWGEGKKYRDQIEGMISLAHGMAPDHIGCAREEFLPLPNVWLGVSAEDQKRADERVPLLLDTPAAIRFVSAEPLLGPVDLLDRLALDTPLMGGVPLHWVIAGGESGPNARPMNPQWARDIRDQCEAAGVAYFHKQNGEWASVSEVEGPGAHHDFEDGRTVRRVGKKAAGRLLDGREHSGMPVVIGRAV